MLRGTVVVNNEGEFFILLSIVDDLANCAVIECFADELQGEEVARVAALRKVPKNELFIAEKYPKCIRQINIS